MSGNWLRRCDNHQSVKIPIGIALQSLPDNAVSSLSQLLSDGVSLVNNEVLVEDLEDLPSLKICHYVRVCEVWVGRVSSWYSCSCFRARFGKLTTARTNMRLDVLWSPLVGAGLWIVEGLISRGGFCNKGAGAGMRYSKIVA